jgi:hypothetical protein
MTDIQPSATPPAAAQARHGLSPRTGFPQIHWVKLYGSRAMGSHWAGSDIDLAFSAPDDCSAALRDHIDRVGVPFP